MTTHAISGWLLSGYGYVANQAQSANAQLGIRLTSSVYPALFLAMVVICLTFYTIDKQLNIRIQNELAERRQKLAQGAGA